MSTRPQFPIPVPEMIAPEQVKDLAAAILGTWARNVSDPQGNVEKLARLAAETALSHQS